MDIKIYIFALATAIMLMFLICPLIKARNWFIRAFDFPRVQILILTLIYFLFSFYYIQSEIGLWVLSVGVLISIAFDVHRIGFYTFFFDVESKSFESNKQMFKILSANVFIKNKEYEKLTNLIKKDKPDLILLLETDTNWQSNLSSLDEDYPYQKLIPKENTYGMLLFSKLKLEDIQVRYLVDENVPSIYTKFKVKESKFVHLFCVHPRPPRPGESSSLQRDAELIKIADDIKEIEDEPALVIGDLNDVAWSHTTRLFKRLSHTLDPRIGRGFYNTFPVNYKFLGVPLDHAFHTKELGLVKMNVLQDIGSDHYPISISFVIDPEDNSNEPRKSDASDITEASKTKAAGENWDGPVKEVES